MYKTKLQELCHQKLWGLPKYSCMKDGPDHNPQFKASVSVNGISFDSPDICRSSKEAHNDAAKHAFLHFTSPSPSSPMANTEIIVGGSKIEATNKSSDNFSNASDGKVGFSMPRAETNEGPKIEEKFKDLEIQSNDLGQKDVLIDLHIQYKSQLQNYARLKKINQPLYSSKFEGPPHYRHFKATVQIDGHTFESPKFFKTLKEAEHAAAKVAFMSLQPEGFEEDDSVLYKNLLQQLTQQEGFCLPSYKTIKCGMPHVLTFYSTVEVEGEFFHGKEAKSKKQAETNAARAAYSAFKERKSSRSIEITSPGDPADECPESRLSLNSMIPADPAQNLNRRGQLEVAPSTKCKEHAKEREDGKVVSAENLSAYTKVSSQEIILSPAMPDVDNTTGNKKSSPSSESVPSSPKEVPPSYPPLKPSDHSSLSAADINKGKTTRTGSYLLCNRVRVYPYFPDVAFPEGITLLPISDDKWVAVSLEFPNEKGT